VWIEKIEENFLFSKKASEGIEEFNRIADEIASRFECEIIAKGEVEK